MKRAKENGLRWLRQAKHNFEVTKKHLKNNDFSDACFMAEQTAQVTLKAFLYFRGERFVNIHSITELVKKSGEFSDDFTGLLAGAGKLDQYYIPTRYPDALAGNIIPAEAYMREQAEDALEIAQKILDLVKNKMKNW
jgi:HEPN domain-containing protein